MSDNHHSSSRLDLDQMLRGGAIPPLPGGASDDASWDEHGDTILAKIKASPVGERAVLDALLGAPILEPEAGEPAGVDVSAGAVHARSALSNAGVTKMSDSDRPKPVPSQRRPSLKELAERVSKTPPPPSVAPASSRATATPLPASSTATPLPLSVPGPISISRSSAPPPSVAPLSTASVAAAATVVEEPVPSQRASAPPSSAIAPVIPLEAARAAAPRKSGGGGMGGLIIAGVGIAAAAGLFFFLRSNDAAKNAANTSTAKTTTAAETVAVETSEAEPVVSAQEPATAALKAEEPKDDSLDLSDLSDASASASVSASGRVASTGPATSGSALVANADSSSKKEPFVPNPDGTLDEAMRKAAGDPSKAEGQPTAAAQESGPKNVPDQPPQGSVSAYVGSVMGRAKACVAGADEPSRATVTFGSNGAVQKVAVGGWAAGKSAAGCIEGALKGGKVDPFSKPTYSFGVTIRP